MKRSNTYQFTEDEIHVLKEALAMYAAYNKHCVLPMLVGDESDLEEVQSEAATAKGLARQFVEIDEGRRWEELSDEFERYQGRPMDMSDVSAFDWFEYMKGNRNKNDN